MTRPRSPSPASRAIERWIHRDLQTSPPKARSLIVTVWGDAIAPHGDAVWLSGLIRLMQPLGLSERLVRTSVYRLGQQGWLTATQGGRRSLYALTPQGKAKFEHAYRRIYAPPTDAWDGAWQMAVLPQASLGADQRRVMRRQLGWDGYAMLAAGVFVRPSRRGGVDATNGPGDNAIILTCQACTDVDRNAFANLALERWDLATIAAEYRAFIARFTPVIRAFSTAVASPEDSFIVRMLLIHAYRRVTLHDPQLPAELLPAKWPATSAYTLCRDFYRLTHRRAEEHLAATLESVEGPLPPAAAYFRERFGGLA